MLEFTTAAESSLDAFLSVSAASHYQKQLRDYAESLLRQELTRPDWCLLGMEAGTPVARTALWAPPGQDAPTDTVLIEADWSDAELSDGHEVLAKAHDLAGELGADNLAHSVDSPPASPQYQEDEDARIRLLDGAGYGLLRDGLRWRYSGSSVEEGREEPGLVFRPSLEVGEAAFVAAIASTYEGTRDSWLSKTIEEHGPLGAARADFRDAQAIEHLPDWWELACTDDGAVAGVIMASRNPSTAVIYYVGVAPKHRGRGLASRLVRRGTDRLVESGTTEIRGDCDRDNIGMVKGFERAGYEQFARRRTYQRPIR